MNIECFIEVAGDAINTQKVLKRLVAWRANDGYGWLSNQYHSFINGSPAEFRTGIERVVGRGENAMPKYITFSVADGKISSAFSSRESAPPVTNEIKLTKFLSARNVETLTKVKSPKKKTLKPAEMARRLDKVLASLKLCRAAIQSHIVIGNYSSGHPVKIAFESARDILNEIEAQDGH